MPDDRNNSPVRVLIDDAFWNRFRSAVIREGIPYQWEALNDRIPGAEPSGCVRNFRVAAGAETGVHAGRVFQDSDLAKWIEGAAFSLRWHPDPVLESAVDKAVETVAAAQQPDGYLNTYYTITCPEKRWTNLRDNHELYCAGHLIEAAVTYYQVTGKRRLLDVVLKLTDHIAGVIGPEEGKLHGYPGHPLIEMALMRLYGVTHDPAHLRLASYFIDERGREPNFFETEPSRSGGEQYPFDLRYSQAHMPLREQSEAVGHAVRAAYLYSGMADVAAETGDAGLADACRRLWKNLTRRRMYITGAIGSSEFGEAFTFDYDLPNDTVYGETCASVGLVFFARRMLRAEKLGEYADVMERALYNGVLSGMQLDGKRFFYVNPLEVVPEACAMDHNKRHVKPERQKWFSCACCPPNINRLIASLEDYIADFSDNTVFVHLYAGGKIVTDGLTLLVDTRYPWDGRIRVTAQAGEAAARTVALRIPSWCGSWALSVNGEAVKAEPRGGYVYLRRDWRNGDCLDLTLEMPVRRVYADPAVREDAGQAALQRGPLVYCLEEADNGAMLHTLRHAPETGALVSWEPELLDGVITLDTAGLKDRAAAPDSGLYTDAKPVSDPVRLRWIPYYAWANRGAGEMRVWLRT